ncbi:MAG: hypothetical protein UW60_C0032G0012 [Candidatus Woesebacteria bacterium GW2011_GWA2_44_33]|uniref:Uncharacterized protein n=3 Tax=Microgenomates group TaxID=1794810 RepID=A0A0G1N8M5_9BACT|nr:MAG: hypothetical protein UW61_C0036G0008 [Candidatus Curtissbacteria bacterium GW2011_GWC1_44_33]KKT65930.1 MAG: hypothetical protein UW60_C0032G0012 [Candidatus Woesebacteria bacterium GW2011_GWA2_44_33]KKU16632.1 MAG: hypothetical protein UX25_C0028G0014 [Candidatus Woesebacteria bacterium GW2011_GWC2_45_9]
MKLNESSWANASAVTVGIIYVFCAAAVAILPGFSRTVAQSWFHGMDLAAIWTGAPRGNFVIGLLTAMVGTWLVGRVFVGLYNRFSK